MYSRTKNISKRPLYSTMDGIIYPSAFSPKCFREALDYKHQPQDVFIVTYPKCGTTWMQNVALYIFRKGRELEDISLFRTYCPFIDMYGLEYIQKMPRPGAIKSHLPYTYMAHSPQAKYIFVARNPKDCVVSFYHHTRFVQALENLDGTFDEFFELFMAGEVMYNDYFDHLMSWYPHQNDRNVYCTTYEDMKKDIKKIIIDVAKFLGKEFIDAIEEDNTVFNNIVLCSSFEYMKNHFKYEMLLPEPRTYEGLKYIIQHKSKLDLPNKQPEMEFIRKGIVGDWKNVLTDEQVERVDSKFRERTAGTEIPNWFSS